MVLKYVPIESGGGNALRTTHDPQLNMFQTEVLELVEPLSS